MLTAKQEKFVRNLVQGMSQREAYKNSYNAENMSDKAIDNEASLLFNNPEISMRYQQLIERAATASVMTAQERLEFLTDVIKGIEREHKVAVADGMTYEYDEPASIKNKLGAIDLMNKMQGEYTTNTKVTLSYEDRLREVVDADEY